MVYSALSIDIKIKTIVPGDEAIADNPQIPRPAIVVSKVHPKDALSNIQSELLGELSDSFNTNTNDAELRIKTEFAPLACQICNYLCPPRFRKQRSL